jgi:hypothetical protein
MSSKAPERSSDRKYHNANILGGACHGDGSGLDCRDQSAWDHPVRRQTRYAFHAHAIVTLKIMAEDSARHG